MKYYRNFFVVVLFFVISKFAYSIEVWPCPGVGFSAGACFPDYHKGVLLLDLGLPVTERPNVYGLSLVPFRSNYKKAMVGAQISLFEGSAADVYGGQLGLANSAGRGAGVQLGLLNFYDDVSFRIQMGLLNAHRISLNWNYGKPRHSGGFGVQVGFVNMSSEGGHFQCGFWNMATESMVLQFGIVNSMDKDSHGLQIGLINEVDNKGTPFIRWNW